MPSETALSAVYQVTARCFAVEEQLIWQRTALFVALNSLILAGLHYFQALPGWACTVVVLAGATYGVLWHFSMARAWTYHQYYIQLSREIEKALGLGDLGVFYGRTR
jgi:hypothetical protein